MSATTAETVDTYGVWARDARHTVIDQVAPEHRSHACTAPLIRTLTGAPTAKVAPLLRRRADNSVPSASRTKVRMSWPWKSCRTT